MDTELIFSTGNNNWETPQDFYNELDKEFHFTLDPCCTKENAKCTKYFTEIENGLLQDWSGETVFCNPPYGRKTKSQPGQEDWIRKSYSESLKPNTIIVMLIPSRTDTKVFHEYIYHKAEIRFIKGRLKFSNSKNAAPFPSMLVIFKSKEQS